MKSLLPLLKKTETLMWSCANYWGSVQSNEGILDEELEIVIHLDDSDASSEDSVSTNSGNE